MKTLITAILAVAAGCGMLAAADDPLQTNSDALRAAVDGKKGVAEIKKLAVAVLADAKKQEGPAPADADKDNWAARQKYAEGVAEYAEYALYSASLGAPAATSIDLISTLETQAPKSKYLTQDAYLVVANAAMTAQEADRAMAFAKKSLTAPKGANAAKAETNAHYIIGVVAANKKDNATASRELRDALPGLKGTPSMEGPALYFLGEAAYAIGRQQMDRAGADQGIKFMLQSALISGPYQSGAAGEARRMKAEMGEK
jgi:hypothetical protein